MDTLQRHMLQRHMPFTGPDGMNELKKIALRFEEKIYAAAVDQVCYLHIYLICVCVYTQAVIIIGFLLRVVFVAIVCYSETVSNEPHSLLHPIHDPSWHCGRLKDLQKKFHSA